MSDYLIQTDEVDSIHFDSIDEVMAHEYKHDRNRRLKNSIMTCTRRDWFGRDAKDGKDIMNFAIYGNSPLLKQVEKMIDQLKGIKSPYGSDHVVKARKRKARRSDQGDELDIHRVYSGNLNTAWKKMVKIENDKVHHHITLFIDVGGSASVEQQDSLWRAAVAVMIADDLINAGKSVKIIVGSSVSGLISGKTVTTDITVKDYNEPLTMERLVAMSHVGFHRVFNFMARCTHKKKVSGGLGYTNSYTATNAPLHIKEEGQGVKYVYIGQSLSKYDAQNDIERIRKVFAKIGDEK